MALIKGTDGIIEIGPSDAPTEVGYVTEWTITRSREVTERGPWINNDTIEVTLGGKNLEGSLSYDIPAGRDSGEEQIDAAYEAGTAIRLRLQSDSGKQYLLPAATFTDLEETGNAAEGYSGTASFRNSGAYTVGDAAA